RAAGRLAVRGRWGRGLQAVVVAARAVRAGGAQAVVAGGMESMSRAPYCLFGMRNGVKAGHQQLIDGVIHDGLWCAFEHCHMGGHAEYTAYKANISREDADRFSYESHQKAIRAIDECRFKEEIVPVEVKGRKGTTVVDTDESPRRDTSMEALAALKPAFPKDMPKEVTNPVVTAGNAP